VKRKTRNNKIWLGLILFLVGSTLGQWVMREQARDVVDRRPIFNSAAVVIVVDIICVGITLAGLGLMVSSCMS